MGHSKESIPEDLKLDCLGLYCPVPIIRLAGALRSLPSGGIVELLADDPGVQSDMEAWSKGTGHRILSQARDSGGKFTFRVQKAPGSRSK